jgi:GAF domain-containing protein
MQIHHEPHSEALSAILARLNQIGVQMSSLTPDDLTRVHDTLQMVVNSAVEVVPGSSSVLYAYNQEAGTFDLDSRVAAEAIGLEAPDDYPRADGMGFRAVLERKRVLSTIETRLRIHPEKVKVGAKAMVCYPLILLNETLGVLYVYLHEDRAFTSLELLTLDNFINQAAMALFLANQLQRAKDREIRKSRELRRIRRAGMLISSRNNLPDTLDAILRMTLEVIDAHYGIFRLVDRSGKNLETAAVAGDLFHPAIETLPISSNTIMGLVAQSREPLNIADLREPPYHQWYYPLDPEIEMRSEVAVPLLGAGGRLEGVLNLESPQVNAFSRDDRYLLQIIANQAVISIQEVRLLDALQAISTRLLTASVAEILSDLAHQSANLLNADLGVIWLEQNDSLEIRAATDPTVLNTRLSSDFSIAGKAIHTKKFVTITHVSLESFRDPFLSTHDIQTGMLFPLISANAETPVGAIGVFFSRSASIFGAERLWEEKVLSIFAHYVTLALQNAAQKQELHATQQKQTVAETFAAVGDVSANLLHRVNNHMGSIPVRIEGIQYKREDLLSQDEYLSENLMMVEQSAVEAMRVVRETLFHLRPIPFSAVDVRDCLARTLGGLTIPDGVMMQVEGLDALPHIWADEPRVSLVFANLLENAIRAMGGRGHLIVKGAREGAFVKIIVQDDGPGIPLDLQNSIFELNSTYQPAEQQRGKLGFGLWWVRTLMTRFDGSVTVFSDGVRGTTFQLLFPVAKQAGSGSQSS